MRVLFIRPKPCPETIGLQHLMIVEPLELEILATQIKGRHEVMIIDMILEKRKLSFFINDFNPNVVCITGYVSHIPVIIAYCKELKHINHHIITIVGGVHVEKFPEDIDEDVIDYRVVRNAVRSLPQLLDFLAGKSEFPAGVLKAGEVVKEETLPEYDFYIPIPDRNLTAKYRSQYFYVFHNKVALIKTSFGCPYQCKFCFCRKITGDIYFARPLDDVINELCAIREEEIYIVDDDFLVSVDRTKKFIRLIQERGIRKKFLVYGRADFIAKNPDLIKAFKQVGLRTVIVGLESFEDHELAGFNKQSDSNTNKLAMGVLKKYNVDCYAAVIISPSWDLSDFKKAGDTMLELGIRFVNLQPLTPLKGTGIQINETDLVIDRSDFARWDLAHVAIRPEKMNLKEYYENIHNLYLRIIFHPKNLLHLLRYPVFMQIKMAKGMNKVNKQYKNKIMELANHA
jgi:hopanoid C-3 methylase